MICLGYFKALADETRLRMLNILNHHELSVNEIVSLMDMGQSRISRHLKVMTDSGILNCRRDGAWAFYSAVSDGDAGRFVAGIRFLFESETMLAKDLEKAAVLMKERRIKSTNFFNAIASEWNYLQQKVLGDFDLNQAILDCIDTCLYAVDLGCGTGELLSSLGKKAGFAVGIDSSRKMLAQARKLIPADSENIELRLGELEHLPVGNGEADLAVISMVMHHLAEPGQVALEVFRILKKDGIFIIADFEKHTNEEMRKKYGDREIKTFQLKQSINLNITIARKES
jgi:DNA-binding transcriptional ArsR family regulator